MESEECMFTERIMKSWDPIHFENVGGIWIVFSRHLSLLILPFEISYSPPSWPVHIS